MGVKEGWFSRRGMDRVKEDIMVEEKKDEDHLLAGFQDVGTDKFVSINIKCNKKLVLQT